ncbi:MAG: zf-HC2 domain-containing protein [Lachnospiraceae bacterium]|nr:zf-HC2 domain-containing protein [Lachnospiraceae bacterium]
MSKDNRLMDDVRTDGMALHDIQERSQRQGEISQNDVQRGSGQQSDIQRGSGQQNDVQQGNLNIKCDVIQDLMPSYLDEICSDASRELVEQHMMNCESCRKRCELLKNWSNDFTVDNMEQKQLDGMKKVRKKMQLQKGFLVVACFYLLWLGYSTFIEYRSPFFPSVALQVISQILLLLAAEISHRHNVKQGGDGSVGNKSTETGETGRALRFANKKDAAVTLVAVFFSGLAFMGMHMAWGHIEAGAPDFYGIDWYEVGPMLSMLFGLVFILNFAGIFYYYPKVLDSQIHRRWMLAVFLTGALLMVSYGGMLHNITSAQVIQYYLDRDTAIICGIGLLGIAVNLLYDRLRG